MEFLDQQIAAPAGWQKFEELCRALFAAVFRDPTTLRYGRSGQPQHGVDIYGKAAQAPRAYFGVQCKGKGRNYGSKVTQPEFAREVHKAEGFDPPLTRWILATTASDNAALQDYARKVSLEREQDGKFSVSVLGWDSLQSLLAAHPHVIEQFYPELGPRLPTLLLRLQSLPNEVLAAVRVGLPKRPEPESWQRELFTSSRDLGPALMGHPLGAADVLACPELPEVEQLWQNLERGFSARLVGSPGAGKSVCSLQVARRAHIQGREVFRLRGSELTAISLSHDNTAALYLIDDAHLVDQGLLRRAEEETTHKRWLLSAHTLADGQAAVPGSIRLNARQAVGVIAASLRADLVETQRVVQRIDDRIGDGIGYEWIEDRISAAEKAERPWQFSFILGGGWRRATNSAQASRAAGADLVLAAAAIRQLASRDAPCQRHQLQPLLEVAGIDDPAAENALNWLVQERLLLAPEDLRCPHQRLSAVLLGHILVAQGPHERLAVGRILRAILSSSRYPLQGIYVLLQEWRLLGPFPKSWTWLVERDCLIPLIGRCWDASDATSQIGAGWLLSELQSYLDDWSTKVTVGYEEIASRWYSVPSPGVGYSIGHFLNQLGSRNRDLAAKIIQFSDPTTIGKALSGSDFEYACEVAYMLHLTGGGRTKEWNMRYLNALDRASCLRLMTNWPDDKHVSLASSYCQLFIWDDEPFGLNLTDALITAIGHRIRFRPLKVFSELHDLIWHGLHLQDPLHMYTGKDAPTPQRRRVGARIAACLEPRSLSLTLSKMMRRDVQSAWQLLDFLSNVDPVKFEETLAQINWASVDEMIGDTWSQHNHEVEVFLQICFRSKIARNELQALILKNISRLGIMSARLAMLAPDVAIQELQSGHVIGLGDSFHFEWQIGAAVVAQIAKSSPEFLEPLLRPHLSTAGYLLSKPNQPFFGEPLLFLCLVWQLSPKSFCGIVSSINPEGALVGWCDSLNAKTHSQKRRADTFQSDRHTAAWLIERTLEREDRVGDVARALRKRFPKRSIPPAKTLEPFEL